MIKSMLPNILPQEYFQNSGRKVMVSHRNKIEKGKKKAKLTETHE